jgi:predicted  nucleic acid-binding Zn-ribbon protein
VGVLLSAVLLSAGLLHAQEERNATERIFGERESEKPAPALATVAIERRLSAVERSLATVEARLGRPVQSATAFHNVERRLQEIERRLEAIARDMKRLDERIRRLERNK